MGKQKKKSGRRRKKPNNGFVINVLMLIVIVLIVFEGKSLISLFSKESVQDRVQAEVDEVFAGNKNLQDATESEAPSTNKASTPATEKQTRETKASTQKSLNSPAIVPENPTPVDDSYFEDAVFIGDSRMEGFRNQSGITQGTFLTAVGMELRGIFENPYIATPQGNITIFQALHNTDYKKVYMSIGTNELGTYDFEEFKTKYANVLKEIKKFEPNAIIYIYSVIYVEEGLTEFDYVNNANVEKANEKILEICEENGYHYINLNEVLSDGNGALISGASSDGVHMYEEYCKKWLDYTKNHYVVPTATTETKTTS